MAEEKHTEFAMKALGLAELFAISFGQERLVVGAKPRVGGALQSKENAYRMEISAPEGTSTGGGKQAVQHIKLIPEQGTTLVIGSVNQVEKTSELRTFEYLAGVHAQRFRGAALPLQEEKYNDVLRRMQAFFSNMGFRLIMSDASKLPVVKPAAEKSGGATGAILGIALIVVAVAIAAFFLLHKH